jgi:DHA2 family multidrug resistance protein-like MFS transporter
VAAGESFGFRRVFVIGVAVFVVASGLCALAPSLPWLVAARFIQGIGSAGVMAIGVGLLRFIYPKRLLGAALGWNAITIALTAAAGPSIGAAILSVASWPWVVRHQHSAGHRRAADRCVLAASAGFGPRDRLVSIALNAAVFGALILGIDRVVIAPWPVLRCSRPRRSAPWSWCAASCRVRIR